MDEKELLQTIEQAARDGRRKLHFPGAELEQLEEDIDAGRTLSLAV